MESSERDIFLRAMDILYTYRLRKCGLDSCFTATAVYAGERADSPNETETAPLPDGVQCL